MTLTRAQLLAIAPRVIPSSPCACGSATHKIEPELRELEGIGSAVMVVCVACKNFSLYSAAGLGLVQAPRRDAAAN